MIDDFLLRLREPRYGAVTLTAVVGCLMATHWPPMVIPALGVVIFVVVQPSHGVLPVTWWVVSGIWVSVAILLYDRMEDHVWLFIAWLVALAVSLQGGEENFARAASRQARILMGLVFAAAVIWKVYFGTFVSGAALWTFITVDSRFRPLASLVGIDEAHIEGDRKAMSQVLTGKVDNLYLDAPDMTVIAVILVSAGTLGLEFLIALTHLLPDSSRAAMLRLPTVALFGVVTYSVVPVLPFAALLGLLSTIVARWSRGAIWIFPLLVLVALARLLTVLA